MNVLCTFVMSLSPFCLFEVAMLILSGNWELGPSNTHLPCSDFCQLSLPRGEALFAGALGTREIGVAKAISFQPSEGTSNFPNHD